MGCCSGAQLVKRYDVVWLSIHLLYLSFYSTTLAQDNQDGRLIFAGKLIIMSQPSIWEQRLWLKSICWPSCLRCSTNQNWILCLGSVLGNGGGEGGHGVRGCEPITLL